MNTLGVSVLERAREIAILRSHGMTTGQVQAMVVAEASIMGAIGGIAAIMTGVLMSGPWSAAPPLVTSAPASPSPGRS